MVRSTSTLPFLLFSLGSLPHLGAFTAGPTFVRSRTACAGSRCYSAATSNHMVEFPEDADSSETRARGISSSELRHMSAARQRRLEEERTQAARFVQGDALQRLRREVYSLRQDLQEARRNKDKQRVNELEEAIWQAQQVDAEFVYHISKERCKAAESSGLKVEAEEHRKEASRARKTLPQFNLDGLWVGKYGDHGFEMINVTYAGDVLIAYKVTGDRNVPQGQVSFSVDLSSHTTDGMLEPIKLTHDAAEQWGSQYLPRFGGKGQVASQGFVNSQWLEGQLILVNQYFSFAWLPIGHQVFFGRPSPELTLKLLRESRTKQHADDQDREFLTRCLEETELLDDEMETTDGIFRSHNQEYYYNQEGCFE